MMCDRNPLEVFFKPKSVAVIGATERTGHVGRAILWNLISSPFGGAVYPVNPRRNVVLGIRAYPSLSRVPDCVQLAVIVTPAESVPSVIRECVSAGVKAAIVISAGFRETGSRGYALEQEVLEVVRTGGIRLIGPNCLGVMCPITGLNATFAPTIGKPGSVALISQSGAICTALLDWSLREQVGFSALISVGSMLDVGWGDLIDYLGSDPHTRSIVIYMESVGDARSFLSAAREVTLSKPILVIKAGKTELAAKAAASHTGALTGSDAVLDAAFRRAGVLRIDELSDIFHMTETLARQPRPNGPRLTIVTNAGGPGVLATDALVSLGEQPASLPSETIDALNHILPPHWSHANPIDVIGDAGPERYEQAVTIAANDPNTDGLLVIMTPQAMSDPVEIARKIAPLASLNHKPILASWMGGERATEGEVVLNQAGIPTFPFPETAVRAFHYMWRYSYNLRLLYETPSITEGAVEAEAASQLIESIRRSGRRLLTEFESKQLLALYGIPTVKTELAETEEDAVSAADKLGYPVVLKLNSFTVTHKTDVDGVKLSIENAEAVRVAYREIQSAVSGKLGPQHFNGVTVQPMIKTSGYELILGSSMDTQFGPVLLFGMGGQLVEVFHDRALALPPLNTTLARRLMEQTRIYSALKGVRGRRGVNIEALEGLLVRFSQLVLEQHWICEIDINPLLASPEGLLALDARVVLYGPQTDPSEIPKPAIRPYPTKYTAKITLQDGTVLNIRPIRPEDEPAFVRFHTTLSEESVYRRYFFLMNLEARTRHERLTRMCFIDYDRQMAFVANYVDYAAIGQPRPRETSGCNWKGVPVPCGPRGLKGESMTLYHNDGSGHFIDVTKQAGVETPPEYYGFTALTGDFDDDGWPDFYIACDSTPSLLFHNKRNGTFEEIGLAAGVAVNEDGREQAGMGATAADYDGDGRLDIFKTNFSADTNTLYRNLGHMMFDDVTSRAGLAVHTQYVKWGAAFIDVDNDGWKDLFIADGHVYPFIDRYSTGEHFQQPRQLFWNRGDGQFFDMSSRAGPGITAPHSSRGIAIGDLDNDGSEEVVVVNLFERPSLLKNFGPHGNSLLIRALTESGRDAVGARITVSAGGHKQIDEVRSGGYHISQGDFRVHFGLGRQTKAELVVRWPDRQTESFGTVMANQWITIREHKGIVDRHPLAASLDALSPLEVSAQR